ncbi:MAG: DMT family transporter [Rikenellaceae bacterium]|jgi:drug/metabolite transporter (DMT)-like permease|nr:DMT family transporter [Rikenellaceae bacterium]
MRGFGEDKNFRGHTSVFVAQVIFGLNMIVGKQALASPHVSANALTFYRMIGTALLVWLVSLFAPKEKVSRKDLVRLFFASLFGIMINQHLFIHGLALTSPIDASIISTISPIITMLLAAVFLREPITLRKAGGVALGVTGAVLLILHGGAARGGGSFSGDVMCVLSATSFALYLTLFRDVIRRYWPVTLMKWMFLFASICSLPFSYGSLSPSLWRAMSAGTMLEVGYVVVFATFIAYLLIPVGQRNLRPTVVSMYSNLQPLVASVAAVALGMAAFGWQNGMAALLVFAGVYFTTTSKSRRQLDAEKGGAG